MSRVTYYRRALAAGVLSLLLLLAVVLWGDNLGVAEAPLVKALVLSHALWPQWFLLVLNWMGTTTGMLVVAAVGAVVLRLVLWHRLPPLVFLAALASGWALINTLKALSGRVRPQGFAWLVEAGGNSFPSGHALITALWTILFAALLWPSLSRRGRLVTAFLAASFTLLMGVSRLLLGLHYPSDVLAGWLAGLSWAGLWLFIFEAIRERTRAAAKN